MREGQVGGVNLEREKIYTITYADDIVLLATEEMEINSMLQRLERYVKSKGLEINTEKTKIMMFRKGRGKRRKFDYKIGNKHVEEVEEFIYLDYKMQNNNGGYKVQ